MAEQAVHFGFHGRLAHERRRGLVFQLVVGTLFGSIRAGFSPYIRERDLGRHVEDVVLELVELSFFEVEVCLLLNRTRHTHVLLFVVL